MERKLKASRSQGSKVSDIFHAPSPSSMTTFATCLHIFRWTVHDLPLSHQPQAVWKDFSKVPLKYGCKGTKEKNWNFFSERSDLLTGHTCTHQNGICCGTRHEFCCTSADAHGAAPRMSTGGGVACPRLPKMPLYIPNRHRGCGMDPCQPNIHLLRVHCHCILLPQSSSIWFGKFLTWLCSKRVNIVVYWHWIPLTEL